MCAKLLGKLNFFLLSAKIWLVKPNWANLAPRESNKEFLKLFAKKKKIQN